MTREPTTEAGRALLARVKRAVMGDHHGASDQWRAGAEAVGHDLEGSVLAIEAQAVARALADLRERVAGLRDEMCHRWHEHTDKAQQNVGVNRVAVLALIDDMEAGK